jgi:hypothetical protein
MPTPIPHDPAERPAAGDEVERRILRLYASIVLLLFVLGGLLWGTITAVQIAPRALDDSVFVALALGGMALAGVVLYLLAQMAQWAGRRTKD